MNFDRLVHTGNVMIDVVVQVPGLPARGGDVAGTYRGDMTGAGFNVMSAASRLGLPTIYAGRLGTGPRADQARADLAAEGIGVAYAPVVAIDTGFVTVFTEPDGERTFVSCFGAELDPDRPNLSTLVTARDALYVSGYSLAAPPIAAALLRALRAIPAETTVVFDPGPLILSLSHATVLSVMARADLVTGNADEARVLAEPADEHHHRQTSDAAENSLSDSDGAIIAAIRARAPHALIVVRQGAADTVVVRPNEAPVQVPAVPARVVNANGAGDAHTGALLAALSRGEDAVEACRYANAAAAYAVGIEGPATGPTTEQLAGFIANRRT